MSPFHFYLIELEQSTIIYSLFALLWIYKFVECLSIVAVHVLVQTFQLGVRNWSVGLSRYEIKVLNSLVQKLASILLGK